jgi:hypothetical protein
MNLKHAIARCLGEVTDAQRRSSRLPLTPGGKFPYEEVFEDDEGHRYYCLEWEFYFDRFGMRSHPGQGWWTHNQAIGAEARLDYLEIDGDRIVMGIGSPVPMPNTLRPGR